MRLLFVVIQDAGSIPAISTQCYVATLQGRSIMKVIKHCILALIVAALFIAASSSASAHHRRGPRGRFFFRPRPMYYDYCAPVYGPRPWSFQYYRGRPGRGFGLGFSRGGFGFAYESRRGRRRDRGGERREEQREEQREERRRND